MPNTEAYCVSLIRILSAAAQANAGQSVPSESLGRAEGLALKFIFHSLSAVHLRRGTKVDELGANFTDAASIHVIVRAALEATLTFAYLFANVSSEEEREFRFRAWVLADLMSRQDFPVLSDAGTTKLAAEKAQIEDLQRSLQSSSVMATLSPKQQRAVLIDQKWRLTSWSRIGTEMGLDDAHAKAFYSYLCSHAHSGFLSVLQIQQADTAPTQQMLVNGSIGMLAIALAHMIRLYVKVFPRCEKALREIQDAEQIVNMWIAIGASTLTPAAASDPAPERQEPVEPK